MVTANFRYRYHTIVAYSRQYKMYTSHLFNCSVFVSKYISYFSTIPIIPIIYYALIGCFILLRLSHL